MAENKISFWILTALVVGNMVGSGIFMLPRTLSEAASPAGVLLGWGVTGFGVLFLALVFGNLAIRKPELHGGPQIYAKELFPKNSKTSLISGFMSSWGYWIGNFAGNAAIITTFASYLSTFFPILNSKLVIVEIGPFTLYSGNLLTFFVCSILLWGLHIIILKGMDGAGKLNFVATAAKVIGFFLFIIIALFAFEKSNLLPLYAPRYEETGLSLGLGGQVYHAAISTLWAFCGVESAVVFSGRAKKKQDIKKATIIGLLLALAIYIGISLLVMGILPQNQLVQSEKPLVDTIEIVLGPIGAYLLSGLGIISLLGSTIGWILLSSEVPYQAAKQGIFIPAFAKENKKGMPVFSLILTNAFTQVFLFSTISNSMASAFDFVIYIATLAFLVPYLISSLYQLKLVVTGETYLDHFGRWSDGIIACLATLYSTWAIFAGTSDLKSFLFGMILLASGMCFFPLLRKQKNVPTKQSAA